MKAWFTSKNYLWAMLPRFAAISCNILKRSSLFPESGFTDDLGRVHEELNYGAMLLAGGRGFEPRLTGPEPVVLPLDDPPTDSPILIAELRRVKAICLFA